MVCNLTYGSNYMNTAVKEKTAKRAKKAITKVIIETPKAKKSKKEKQ
jgi:hypothetical protein